MHIYVHRLAKRRFRDSFYQLFVIALLYDWGQPRYAAAVAVLLILQIFAMRHMLKDPRGRAPWYNGAGVTLHVLGMMASAVAVRSLPGVAG